MEIVLLVAEMLIVGRTDGRVANVKSGTVMIVVGLERTHAKNADLRKKKMKKKM
jgi:ribosomal protein L16/L10AE